MKDGCFGSVLIGLAVLSASIWPQAAAQTLSDPFAACEEVFAAEPRERPSAECFFEVAKREGQWSEAAQKLEHHLERYSNHPWLHLYLGHVFLFQLSPRAEGFYRKAIEILDSTGQAAESVEVRLDLSRCLVKFERREEAGQVLEQAFETAEAIGVPTLMAAVRIRQAFQLYNQGRDLDYAYHLLNLVEEDVFSEGSEKLKAQWLDAMSVVSNALGRIDEARRCKERFLAMAREAGDLSAEAAARFDVAALRKSATELPSPSARQEIRRLFEEALATAEAAEHRSIAVRAHLELGRLLPGEAGRRHLEACLSIASALGETNLGLVNRCRGALAANLVEEDPRQANELIDQALAASRDSNDLWALSYGSVERLTVRWATLARPEAISDSLAVLDTLDAFRELQSSRSGRAGLMTIHLQVYYWLFARLLGGTEAPERELPVRWTVDRREDLELAFSVAERMRARVLLEALEAARAASPPSSADPLVRQLDEVLKRKVRLNRLLLEPELELSAREQAISELGAVESEEAGLQHQIAQTSPSYGALRSPSVATLGQVEQSLAETEALLSYLVGPEETSSGRFVGGSWLLVSTREGTRSYRLPGSAALEPALDVLLGVPELDEATAGLVHFFRNLLEQALSDLPSGIDRLVFVPDGELHRLPFAILRSAPGSEPLITRYQLSMAPSATLWLRWRHLDPPTSEVAALVFADPLLAAPQAAPGGTAGGGSGERQWAFGQGARLERLPFARKEGRTVVRTLGGKSRLLLGAEATESFLKENDLGRYGVLHFATHAVINDEVPERSAVLLAPGAEDEDGWLQPQDIVELELEGRVVVLASCNSAAGQVLRGEGPMSLARSFFHAGAPVVVASLWPLPDDETARLFKEFYRSLATGTSVAGALATAQRKMLRRGAPARSWAGLVALGDGDLVPFPGGLPGRGLPAWVYPVLALLGIAALLLVLRRVRRAA